MILFVKTQRTLCEVKSFTYITTNPAWSHLCVEFKNDFMKARVEWWFLGSAGLGKWEDTDQKFEHFCHALWIIPVDQM
jgi:hypothetical protein